MKKNLNLDKLQKKISQADTMYSGLLCLKDALKPFGIGALVYGYMLHLTSHLRRGDYILYATFPENIRDIGEKDGGSLTFRFGDVVPRLNEPLFFDMSSTLHGEGPLYSHNKTYQAIYDIGYCHAWLVPFGKGIENGFGHMIMFQDFSDGAPTLDINKLKSYAPLFHNLMLKNKQLAKHFKLTSKQIEALSWASKGRTASYLAEKLNLSERSIELRLHGARQNLHAKTTAEAVYKALSYGILPSARHL